MDKFTCDCRAFISTNYVTQVKQIGVHLSDQAKAANLYLHPLWPKEQTDNNSK